MATRRRSLLFQGPEMFRARIFSRSSWSTCSAVVRSAISRKAVRFSSLKKFCAGGLGPFPEIDLPLRKTLAQLRGGDIDQFDFIRFIEHGIRHGLTLGGVGDLCHDIRAAFEMLDIERGVHGDAGGEQLEHILVTLRRCAASRGRWYAPVRPREADPDGGRARHPDQTPR